MKRLKLLPSHYKSSNLSQSQKRHIRRITAKLKARHGEAIYRESASYISTTTTSKKKADKFKKAGYTVKRTGKRYTVIAKRGDAKKLKINRDDSITREFMNRKVRAYPGDDVEKIMERAEKFFKHKRSSSDYATMQFGGSSPFNRVIGSLEEFYKYEPMFRRILKAHPDLIPEIQFVEVIHAPEKTKASPRLADTHSNRNAAKGRKRRNAVKARSAGNRRRRKK